MKTTFKTITFLALLLSVSIAPVYAAKLTAKHISTAENKNIVSVYLNTEGQVVNTVDGSMLLDGFAGEVTSISIAESPLSLWPNKPSLVDSKLSFTGGIPGGISGSEILLFTINLRTESPLELRIIPNDLFVYLNNGRGDLVRIDDSTILLAKGDTFIQSSKPKDLIPPEKFVVDIGKDDSVLDGKYFVSFFTRDNETGIARYEVTEGDKAPVLADSPYVLRDQTLNSPVTVRAYDNEGNVTVAMYVPEHKLPIKIKFSIILILLLLLIGLVRITWIKFKKRKAK